MAPLIGLTGRRASRADSVRGSAVAAGWQYVQAVSNAGGQTVVLPPTHAPDNQILEVVSRLDGVLLHGGVDISPRRYGEQPHSEVKVWDDALDDFEMKVLQAAINEDKPVLAICRGMQLLNVSLGGSLVQHLPDDESSSISHWSTSHEIVIRRESTLFNAVQEECVASVSSYHHQAIGKLGAGLQVVAHAPDGVIEGVEHAQASWVVGVQWHPEDTLESGTTQQLFQQFVIQCAHESTSLHR